MQVTVRCFSTVRERLGTGRLTLDLPDGSTLSDLVAAASTLTPAAAVLDEWLAAGHLRVALNHAHASPTAALSPGDEVALFPPVSGG